MSCNCFHNLVGRTVWTGTQESSFPFSLLGMHPSSNYVDLGLAGRRAAVRRTDEVFLSDPMLGDAVSVASFIASHQEDCTMNPSELDKLVQMSKSGDYLGMSPPYTPPQQEVLTTMSNTTIERVTRIGGQELAQMSENSLIAMIKRLQDDKKAILDLGVRGAFADKKLAEIHAAMDEVTAELNRRAGGSSPAVEA